MVHEERKRRENTIQSPTMPTIVNNTGCPPYPPSQATFFTTSSCNNHGTCIQSPSTQFSHLCVCETGWSGATDLFDLRVGVDPITGQVLSLTCATPNSGTYVMWGVLLFTHLLRQIILMSALKTKFSTMPTKEVQSAGGSKIRACWNYMPTRVLIAESCLANPLMLAAAIQRLATVGTGMDEMILGTSTSITVCFALGILLMFTFFSDFSLSQFTTLAKSRMLSNTNGAIVIARFRRGQLAEWFLYFMSSFVCPLIALGLDKAIGPVASNEVVVLVVRNCGVVIMMLLRIWNAHGLIREVETILVPIQNLSQQSDHKEIVPLPQPSSPAAAVAAAATRSKDGNSSGVTGKSEAAARVLDYLREQQREIKKSALIGGTCYLLFSIPPFWPYQLYGACFVVSLATVTNNEGLVFLRANKEAKKSSSALGSNQQVQVAVSHTGAAEDTHSNTGGNSVTEKSMNQSSYRE